MAAPKRPQLNKMAKGKAAPMSRTSGTARRLTGRSEGIATKLKYGAPLTGSASGVKSISLKDVGETLTQGAFSVNRKGLTTDAANLAMALPLGKVLKARNALALGGKITRAVALDERLAAKAAGKAFGRSLAERNAAGSGPIFETIKNTGAIRRGNSQSVFPRAPKKGALGDLEAGALPGSNMTNVQARRLAASRAADRAGNYTPVRELEKRLKLPKGK